MARESSASHERQRAQKSSSKIFGNRDRHKIYTTRPRNTMCRYHCSTDIVVIVLPLLWFCIRTIYIRQSDITRWKNNTDTVVIKANKFHLLLLSSSFFFPFYILFVVFFLLLGSFSVMLSSLTHSLSGTNLTVHTESKLYTSFAITLVGWLLTRALNTRIPLTEWAANRFVNGIKIVVLCTFWIEKLGKNYCKEWAHIMAFIDMHVFSICYFSTCLWHDFRPKYIRDSHLEIGKNFRLLLCVEVSVCGGALAWKAVRAESLERYGTCNSNKKRFVIRHLANLTNTLQLFAG